jgi:hypothetical protein
MNKHGLPDFRRVANTHYGKAFEVKAALDLSPSFAYFLTCNVRIPLKLTSHSGG